MKLDQRTENVLDHVHRAMKESSRDVNTTIVAYAVISAAEIICNEIAVLRMAIESRQEVKS